MPKRKKSNKSLKGYKRASNKTKRFTYYYNPKTKHVFKDTNKNMRKG